MLTKPAKFMSRELFIANLIQLKMDLNTSGKSIRELKSLYFNINLDYIRQCEATYGDGYFPSRECDLKMRECLTDTDTEQAKRIIQKRIEQVLSTLK